MKILIISEYFPESEHCEIKGGVETRAFAFAKELAKQHDVSVISSWEKGVPKESSFAGIKVVRCGPEREYSQLGSLFSRLKFLFESYKIGRKMKPDLVDGYNFVSYIPAMWIAKKLKIPSVATYHDVWVGKWIKNVGWFSGIIGEVIERYVLWGKGKKWTHFITNSECTKKKLIDFGVKEEKIDSVYCGVFLDDCGKITVEKFDQPTVIYVGRLVPYKRIMDLIIATKKVREHIKDFRCLIVGSGPLKDRLAEFIKKNNAEDFVKLVGFVEKHEDVIKMIKQSHLFCLPSEVEGLGLVTIEAMACGVPYVNSKIPPTLEATEGGKGGLLHEVGDTKQLAKNIIRLLEDKEFYKKCVEEENIVVEKYAWKELVKGIEDIYKKLVS